MAQPLQYCSLNAGELSPDLYARTDFKKYKDGLALCRNFFVDQRGGVINRSGTRFVGAVQDSSQANRLIPFTFSSTQTYVLVFGDLTLRFVQDGGYVTETATSITAVTQSNPGIVTDTAHGYSDGDLIYVSGIYGMTQLNGRFFTVASATANTYTLLDLFGDAVDTSGYNLYTSGGTADRIYTIATPYLASELALLKFTQSADVMTICHPDHAPQQLIRYAHTNWAITEVTFGPLLDFPNNPSAIASSAGSTQYNYVVTAINGSVQSRASSIISVSSVPLTTTVGAKVTIGWNPVASTTQYYVYRTGEVLNGNPAPGSFFGFIGATNGNSFVDNNIAPNFAITPPQASSPFSTGNQFASVAVTTGGSGYASTISLVVSDVTGTGALLSPTVVAGVITAVAIVNPGNNYSTAPIISIIGAGGSGALAQPVLNASTGAVTSVTVVNGGTGYSNPSATIQSEHGAGATFTVTVAAGVITAINVVTGGGRYGTTYYYGPGDTIEGHQAPAVIIITDAGSGSGATFTPSLTSQTFNPFTTCYYQQRQVYGGLTDAVDEMVFSKTGDYNNFDVSYITQDDDAITVNISSQQQNEIKHLVPFNSLLVFSSGACWKVDSGTNGGPLTPASITALPQSFNGCSDVPPIVVNYDVLYVQAKQSTVRDLSYNFYQNLYAGNDVSVLANHLFYGHRVVEWAFAQEPHKVIWAVREDGLLLALTYVKEQEIYAWTRHDSTNGLFKSVCTVAEDQEDVIYVIVERLVNGQFLQYIERMQSRLLGGDIARGIPGSLDRCWFVDSGLQTSLVYPAATLTPAATDGTPTITSVVVIDGGSGYVSPVAAINDPTGTGATVSVTVVAGIITAVDLTAAGSGYTNPTVYIADSAGTGATTQVVLKNLLSMTTTALVAGDVGSILRANGGIGTVHQVSTGTVLVDMQRPLNDYFPVDSGDWSCTPLVSTVTGLDHLNGQTVAILADGGVQAPRTVVDGSVTLDTAASLITVGLPITAQGQSLDVDTGENPTMQSKRGKVNCITAQVKDSRGLKVGHTFDSLYEVKERSTQPMGQPVQLITTNERVVVDPLWETPITFCFQQDQPLPAQINGLVVEVSIGDTPR